MKTKIVIVYNYILHYRIPFFNKLGERYDLTVIHSGTPLKHDVYSFDEVVLPLKKIGPFRFQIGLLGLLRKQKYKFIILLFDVAWLSSLLAFIINGYRTKIVLWGAWFTPNKYANWIRIFLSRFAFANVFYSNCARKEFINKGIQEDAAFVANNTFDVGNRVKSYLSADKYRLLFVGSLDERKQLDIVIKSFHEVIEEVPEKIILTIVGSGYQEVDLKNLAKNLNLKDRVQFVGRIDDPVKLQKYYRNALATVSYGQAGLSVLQSLGFGVPFITKKNAISGGEIYNIKDGYNGFLLDGNKNSLKEVIKKICYETKVAQSMGRNAYYYYDKYCTMDNMVQGFLDAMEGTKISKIDKRL